jgi:hypothetical protein
LNAWSDISATIEADNAAMDSGIKSYETSAEVEASTGEAFWFCQVVGRPTSAGSICITVSDDQEDISAVVRHARSGSELRVVLLRSGSLFVTRRGEQVASLIMPPLGTDAPGLQVGFEELGLDPAWRVFCAAMGDSNLRASMSARVDVNTTDCATQCLAQYPDPPNCNPDVPTIYCCQVQAERDYCQAVCECATAWSPTLCATMAAAQRMADWTYCAFLPLQIIP